MMQASWLCAFWWLIHPEEPGSAPAGTGDGDRNLGEAWIGLTVPRKALGQNRNPVHLAVPFARQDRSRSEVLGTSSQIDGALPCILGRPRTIEQPLTFNIKVAQVVGLETVRQDPEQQVTWQVRGRSFTEHGVPAAAKTTDVEIAKARDLDVNRGSVRQSRTDL
jgi:hypothetical protein